MSLENKQNLVYATVDQVVQDKKYPFSKGQIQYFLTNRHKNGLEKVIRKIGKRIYFRTDLFDDWIESQCKERDQ
jgi:signal recognition particle subunit SEC65